MHGAGCLSMFYFHVPYKSWCMVLDVFQCSTFMFHIKVDAWCWMSFWFVFQCSHFRHGRSTPGTVAEAVVSTPEARYSKQLTDYLSYGDRIHIYGCSKVWHIWSLEYIKWGNLSKYTLFLCTRHCEFNLLKGIVRR